MSKDSKRLNEERQEQDRLEREQQEERLDREQDQQRRDMKDSCK